MFDDLKLKKKKKKDLAIDSLVILDSRDAGNLETKHRRFI